MILTIKFQSFVKDSLILLNGIAHHHNKVLSGENVIMHKTGIHGRKQLIHLKMVNITMEEAHYSCHGIITMELFPKS